jgi:heat shock protein HtpX
MTMIARVNPAKLAGHRMLNVLHSMLLLGAMLFMFAVTGLLLGGLFGLGLALGFGSVLFLVSHLASSKLLLHLYSARPLELNEAPELYRLVEALAARADLDVVPLLYYVPSRVMNAFVLGSRKAPILGVTDGLLRGMNRREMTGVLAHEIGHIVRCDLRVMRIADVITRLTSLFATFGQILLFLNLPLLLTGVVAVYLPAILLMIFAPMINALLQLALSRTREFDADLEAARITGDPEGLALALQKLDYQSGGIWQTILFPGRKKPEPSLLRTHPDTADRINRLMSLVDVYRPVFVDQPFEREILANSIDEVFRRPRWRIGGIWY